MEVRHHGFPLAALMSRTHLNLAYSDRLSGWAQCAREFDGMSGVLLKFREVLILNLENLAFADEHIFFASLNAILNTLTIHMRLSAHVCSNLAGPRLRSEADTTREPTREQDFKSLSDHRYAFPFQSQRGAVVGLPIWRLVLPSVDGRSPFDGPAGKPYIGHPQNTDSDQPFQGS